MLNSLTYNIGGLIVISIVHCFQHDGFPNATSFDIACFATLNEWLIGLHLTHNGPIISFLFAGKNANQHITGFSESRTRYTSMKELPQNDPSKFSLSTNYFHRDFIVFAKMRRVFKEEKLGRGSSASCNSGCSQTS